MATLKNCARFSEGFLGYWTLNHRNHLINQFNTDLSFLLEKRRGRLDALPFSSFP